MLDGLAAAFGAIEGLGEAGDSALEVAAFSAELVGCRVLRGLALAVGAGSFGVVGPLAGTAGASLRGLVRNVRPAGHRHRINARDEKARAERPCIVCHHFPRPRSRGPAPPASARSPRFRPPAGRPSATGAPATLGQHRPWRSGGGQGARQARATARLVLDGRTAAGAWDRRPALPASWATAFSGTCSRIPEAWLSDCRI